MTGRSTYYNFSHQTVLYLQLYLESYLPKTSNFEIQNSGWKEIYVMISYLYGGAKKHCSTCFFLFYKVARALKF